MSLKDAYRLMRTRKIHTFFKAYMKEDQRLMHGQKWDYDNPLLLTNQVKEILSEIDLNTLNEEEHWRCKEILWFWHHHAISSAIWRQKSRTDAIFHANEALRYQDEGHPNKITRLLHLLIHDKLEEAEKWAEQIHEDEQEATEMLFEEYRAGRFF